MIVVLATLTITLVAVTTAARAGASSAIIARRMMRLGGLLLLFFLFLDLLNSTRPDIRGMISRKGSGQDGLIRRNFFMGLHEFLLPRPRAPQEGSFVELDLSGDGDVPTKELALDVSDDRSTMAEVLMRGHLEGLLAVKQEANGSVLEVLHPRNLFQIVLDTLKPKVLVLGLALHVKLLEDLGPDGNSRTLEALWQKLEEELSTLAVVLIEPT